MAALLVEEHFLFSIIFGIVFISSPSKSLSSCSPTPQCTTNFDSITCDTGTCNIECNGYNACNSPQLDIYCSVNTTCNVICDGEQACKTVYFFATDAHQLSITIPSGSNSGNALYDAIIWCPNNGPGGSASCSIRSNDNLGSWQYSGMTINAVEGFNDVTIYCLSADCNLDSTVVQCTSDYSSSCTAVGSTQIIDRCKISNSEPTYCETYLLPTFQPTLTPTRHPTIYPSRYPSRHPTIYPTIYPSRYPTTSIPTTSMPITNTPTTAQPTTYSPTTHSPTTFIPTTSIPTSNVPTTDSPTTTNPTSAIPTTSVPTTATPTITTLLPNVNTTNEPSGSAHVLTATQVSNTSIPLSTAIVAAICAVIVCAVLLLLILCYKLRKRKKLLQSENAMNIVELTEGNITTNENNVKNDGSSQRDEKNEKQNIVNENENSDNSMWDDGENDEMYIPHKTQGNTTERMDAISNGKDMNVTNEHDNDSHDDEELYDEVNTQTITPQDMRQETDDNTTAGNSV